MLTWVYKNRHFEAFDIFNKQLQVGLTNIDEVISVKFRYQIHGFALTSGLISLTCSKFSHVL